jgi:hypothetical protein
VRRTQALHNIRKLIPCRVKSGACYSDHLAGNGGWRLAAPLAMKSRLGGSDMSLVDLDPCTMMGEARQGCICSIVSQHTDCIFVEDPRRYTPYPCHGRILPKHTPVLFRQQPGAHPLFRSSFPPSPPGISLTGIIRSLHDRQPISLTRTEKGRMQAWLLLLIFQFVNFIPFSHLFLFFLY